MSRILHIDDNEGDILLTQEALKTFDFKTDVSIAYNGEQGLNFLKQTKHLPDLILLDINMPVLDGKEFLAQVKKDEFFKAIPVVMLTTSYSRKDVEECYKLHANAYVTKSYDFTSYTGSIGKIMQFWLDTNISILKV